MTRTRRPYRTVHCRVECYLGYTVAPHDKERRKRDIERHEISEDWVDGMPVGALSRYVLWEYVARNAAINRYYKDSIF